MGSWNVKSIISNLTIGEDDPVVLVLMIPNTGIYTRITSSIISEAGALTWYKPYCGVIQGYYNDYGQVKDIVRNQTVLDLEAKFGMSIEQLCARVDRGESKGKDEHPDLAKIVGGFEHLDFYQNFVRCSRVSNSILQKYMTPIEILNYMEFKKGDSEVEIAGKLWETYTYKEDTVYYHPDERNLRVKVDDTYRNIPGLKELLKYCKCASLRDDLLSISQLDYYVKDDVDLPIQYQLLTAMFGDPNIGTQRELLETANMVEGLTELHRLLIPSNYAGQETDTEFERMFHDLTVQQLVESYRCSTTEYRKTSQVWCKIFRCTVMDPDGWDRQNYDYSFNEELITVGEFLKRCGGSTMLIRGFL